MNYLENRKCRYCNTIRSGTFCTHYNTYYYVLRPHEQGELKLFALKFYIENNIIVRNERNENKKRNKTFCRFDKLVKYAYNK